jgi:hypothetical protein
MSQKDPFPDYPGRITFSTERSNVSYVRSPGYYAVHRNAPDAAPADALFALNEGAIAVYRGEHAPPSGTRKPKDLVTPVYVLQPGGSPAVPTGLIFIRFPEGTRVEDLRKEIEDAGYRLADIPAYAPHTAWVAASSGNIAQALSGVATLERVNTVQNVEPQMLVERSTRIP